jgi:glycosyltransferase involved in cell wall biosynthesis
MRIIVSGNCQGKGGGPTHFQLLLRFLVEEGHIVMGIGTGDKDLCQVDEPGLYDFIRVNQTASSFRQKVSKRLLLESIAVKAMLFNPSLYVAVGYGKSYAFIAQKLRNTQCFRFYHELIANPPENDPLRSYLVDSFDGVAVQSPKMRDPFLHSIPTSKPVVSLPCFANVPPFINFPQMPTLIDPIRLAYFGRLASNKGLVQFIHSFSSIAEEQNLYFDIYGSGPEEESIKKTIASQSLSHRVKLKGSYPNGREHAKLLSSYHSLILPSIDGEGLPLVLLEAMSTGLPFLSTNIGAISDSAQNNPDVLVAEPTIPALTSALCTHSIRLREGEIVPSRLKSYYDTHYSTSILHEQWRKMLVSPESYFNTHE